MQKIKDKYLSFNGKKYAVDLDVLKSICLTSSMDGGGTKEIEISQSYERNDDGDFELAAKLEHETKMIGNTQNDMIIYDIIKLMFVSLLDNTIEEKNFYSSLSTSLSLNTLLKWGVIIEIE